MLNFHTYDDYTSYKTYKKFHQKYQWNVLRVGGRFDHILTVVQWCHLGSIVSKHGAFYT